MDKQRHIGLYASSLGLQVKIGSSFNEIIYIAQDHRDTKRNGRQLDAQIEIMYDV